MNSSYRWYWGNELAVYLYWHDAIFISLVLLVALIIVVYKYLQLKKEIETHE